MRYRTLLLLLIGLSGCAGEEPKPGPVAWAAAWADRQEQGAGELPEEEDLFRLAGLDGFLRRTVHLGFSYPHSGRDRCLVVVEYARRNTWGDPEWPDVVASPKGVWESSDPVPYTTAWVDTHWPDLPEYRLTERSLLLELEYDTKWRIIHQEAAGLSLAALEGRAGRWESAAEKIRLPEEIIPVRVKKDWRTGEVTLATDGEVAGPGELPPSAGERAARGAELQLQVEPGLLLPAALFPWQDQLKELLPGRVSKTTDFLIACQRQPDGSLWSATESTLIRHPARPSPVLYSLFFRQSLLATGPVRAIFLSSNELTDKERAALTRDWFRAGARRFEWFLPPERIPFRPEANPEDQVAWVVDMGRVRVTLLHHPWEAATAHLSRGLEGTRYEAEVNPAGFYEGAMPGAWKDFQDQLAPLLTTPAEPEETPAGLGFGFYGDPDYDNFPSSALLSRLLLFTGFVSLSQQHLSPQLAAHELPDALSTEGLGIERRGVTFRLEGEPFPSVLQLLHYCFHFRSTEAGWKVDAPLVLGPCEPTFDLEWDFEAEQWRVVVDRQER